MPKEVKVGGRPVDGKPFTFIGGPCVIEGRDATLAAAEKLAAITSRLRIPFIFKSSYDKANRTSIGAFRGPGIEEGLKILKEVKDYFGVPVLTDVHSPQEAALAADVVDVIQVPALLSRQTDLLVGVRKNGQGGQHQERPVPRARRYGLCDQEGGVDGECADTRHRARDELRLP